jgi:putative ABC transport system ATP-binding protein
VGCEISELRVQVPNGNGGQRVILDIPNIKFTQGSFIAIAGASGSGKTTLLHCLSGICRPAGGKIRMKDVRLESLKESECDTWRRTQVGLMFQDFQLVPELTALENVLLPTQFARCAIEPDRASALLALHGVVQHQAPVNLMSRGEQQRVALVRALLFNPPFIIADEPTASLDRGNASSVITALQNCASSGQTVIVASHDAEILSAARRVIVLDHGCIVRQRGDKAA